MSYDGQVIETMWQMGRGKTRSFTFRVRYEDGGLNWHAFGELDWTRLEIIEDDVVGDLDVDGLAESNDLWEKLEMRCALSMMPLTDPAKGCACRHRAICNYPELRDYVGRMKACPVAGCDAKLARTRDVERDEQLRYMLQSVAERTDVVWVRGGELQTTAPACMQTDRRHQQNARGKRANDKRQCKAATTKKARQPSHECSGVKSESI